MPNKGHSTVAEASTVEIRCFVARFCRNLSEHETLLLKKFENVLCGFLNKEWFKNAISFQHEVPLPTGETNNPSRESATLFIAALYSTVYAVISLLTILLRLVCTTVLKHLHWHHTHHSG